MGDEAGNNSDSDAEFEAMIREKDGGSDDVKVVKESKGKSKSSKAQESKGKAKMKIGQKNKKNIVKFVNKVEKSSFVALVLEPTILPVLIQNWMRLQKESGLVLTVKPMDLKMHRLLTRKMNTWNSVGFAKKVVKCYAAILVPTLIICNVSILLWKNLLMKNGPALGVLANQCLERWKRS